jgi:biotin carboxyl carrier protein
MILFYDIPGIVKSIAVEVGQRVNEGHEICTVEAMKMQNKLNASRTGKVTSFFLCIALKTFY